MAARLGATFLVGALGPVNIAGNLILGSQVPEGLRELAPANLHGGLSNGIAFAAKRVGVAPADVEGLLPMAELRTVLARIGFNHQRSVEAWSMYAGQVGGFLKGVADLTADGRAPDVGLCLERLSKKFSRDKPLAEPLHALSVDISAWQDLIARCRDILDDGGVLKKAYQRRRIRRILLATVPAIIAVGALSLGLWYRVSQVRIDAALAKADPCAVLDIAPDDLSRSSSSQRGKLEERRTECQKAREQEIRQKEEQAKKEAAAREADRVRKEREGKCDALATHLASGQLTPEDEAVAGASSPLLQRIIKGALDPADLGPKDPVLPCADAPAGTRITDAFGRAVLAVPGNWANAEDPSALVRATLVKHGAELPTSPKQVLAWRADKEAKKALLVGGAENVERATRLCQLKEALGFQSGSFCTNVAAGVSKAP